MKKYIAKVAVAFSFVALFAAAYTFTQNVLIFGDLELGHESDTTISRVSAGLAAIEGDNIVDVGQTGTVTSTMILNNTVAASDIAADTIDGTELADTITLDAALNITGALTGFNDATPDARVDIENATADQPGLIVQSTDDSATNPSIAVLNSSGIEVAAIEADGTVKLASISGLIYQTGTGNSTYLGDLAGANDDLSSNQNTGIGWKALTALTSGSSNVAIGANCGSSITSGTGNTLLGVSVGSSLTTENNVTAFGSSISLASGGSNMVVAGANSRVGTQGSSFGDGAGHTSSNRTVNFGYQAGREVTGSNNTNIGWRAGHGLSASTKTAAQNVAVGESAFQDIDTATRGVAIGYLSGENVTTGGSNIVIGYKAGDVLTTGASNIIIGYDVDPTGATVSNELNIGGTIFGNLSSKFVGIGDTTPEDLLNVHSAAAQSAIAITSLGTDTDALLKLELLDGTANYCIGVDDSDSDRGKISTTALGTGDILVWNTAGNVGTPNDGSTLGAAATAIAATSNCMTITGDGGANTVATITGGVSGQLLTLIFVDALVTVTDDNSHAANSVDLSAAFTSADDTTLQVMFDGTSWYEVSRSVN